MREIKFRAWDKQRNEWYGASNPESLTFIGFSVFGECTLLCTPSVEDLMHLEITQYTCIKDKNGVEIYEGDIVIIEREDDCFGRDNYKERVVVEPPIYEELEAYCSGGPDGTDTVESILVIGNIYENPELLT